MLSATQNLANQHIYAQINTLLCCTSVLDEDESSKIRSLTHTHTDTQNTHTHTH